jgi:hypothetical protein
MNFVVGTLLLFVDEEEAFYLLDSIIQMIPEYYEKEMLGRLILIETSLRRFFFIYISLPRLHCGHPSLRGALARAGA